MRSIAMTSGFGSLRHPGLWALLLLSFVLVAAACTTNDDADEDKQATDQATDEGAAELIVLGGSEEDDGEPAVALGDAAAVFAAVSPAVVLVETPSGAATGIVIEGGFVLTNSQAVWPHASASIRLAGGTVVPGITVLGVDRLLDIALLGPLMQSTTSLSVAETERPAIGSKVFLVGYASRDAGVTQPSISTGLISGERRWEPGALTFLQSDAPVSGDQLGGALVTETGALVGLAGPGFGTDRISLFASIADLRAQMDAQLAGESIDLAATVPEPGVGSTSQVLGFFRDDTEQLYIINGQSGDTITITLEGNQDGGLRLLDASGTLVDNMDETTGGLEILQTVLQGVAPFTLVVENSQGLETEYELTTSLEVARFQDDEDGRVLTPGASVRGVIDVAGDEDAFRLELAPGQSVEIATTSIVFDTVLKVTSASDSLLDDDSAGGPRGTDSQVTVESDRGGEYTVRVADVFGGPGGAYVVTVKLLGTAQDAGTEGEGASASGEAVLIDASLPAGRGLALRGDSEADTLVPRIATIGAVPGPMGASQSVTDEDGVFAVVATIKATDTAAATVTVLDADGEAVATPPVLTVTCAAGARCVGSVLFEVTAESGPWLVELVGVGGQIDGWQLEILRDESDAENITLPAE
ncbi:MAG TPA: serine protease [Dehalococcoidia bacterium]|nr:serine protease [Dehalococcoidia bacterium]